MGEYDGESIVTRENKKNVEIDDGNDGNVYTEGMVVAQ